MVQTAEKIRWQLTKAAFDRLLSAFDPHPEVAGNIYLVLRRNLIRFFEVRGIKYAEDASDEVLNRLARKVENGENIDNINTYALGVARMLALELRKSPLQKTTNEVPEIGVPPFDHDQAATEEKLGCLESCLSALSGENRTIIIDYYQGEKREKIENRRRLAGRLGIPQNALRNRAVRLRDTLETCITRCLRDGI